jgi:hypothetical protein
LETFLDRGELISGVFEAAVQEVIPLSYSLLDQWMDF